MISTRLLLPLAAAGLAALLAPQAHAQTGSGGGNPASLKPPGFGAPAKSKSEAERREEAPPALPGARAEPTAVAPATKTPLDMPPTEALFDAINRGDLPAARDAVNRGADINGVNVLGLTPIELAVDLGRNQLSFYLLSLRGGDGMTVSGPPSAQKPPGAAERRAAAREAALAARAEKAEQRRAVAAEAAPPTPQTARLFVGGGGTPVPQAGFLGFDTRR